MSSSDIVERVKLYATTFAACSVAVGLIAAPLSFWAVNRIEVAAKEVLESHGPVIVTRITNKKFDEVYLAGFRDLDERNRGIETKQLHFEHLIDQYKRDSKADHNLTQEKIKGIDSKLNIILDKIQQQRSQ